MFKGFCFLLNFIIYFTNFYLIVRFIIFKKSLVFDYILKTLVSEDKPILPTLLIDDGIVICVNDEQALKAEFPIEVTDDGIVTCVNDEQALKAEVPIEVTDDGIVI